MKLVKQIRELHVQNEIGGSCTAFGALWVMLALIPSALGVDLTAWSHIQTLSLAQTGLVKIALPTATLAAARPGLEDLRIVDPEGNDVPFVLERPRPKFQESHRVKSLKVQLKDQTTVATIETGLDLPLDGATLESPVSSFFKSAHIEGSNTGQEWQVLATGQPWFRRSGVTQLHLRFPARAWRYLRVLIDDSRSEPIPLTDARVHAAESEFTPSEATPVEITERVENPGQTRITLRLDTANQTLAWLQLDCADTVFTRRITAAVQEVTENAIRERPIAEATVYRLALENQAVSSNLSFSLEQQIPTRELIVLIQNDDSPPLQIQSIQAFRRPVYATCLIRNKGSYGLYCGHNTVSAPQYDLARLATQLREAPLVKPQSGAIEPNPRYRVHETLPEVGDIGAKLDVSSWGYRKSISLAQPGVQQLELDLDILAHAQLDFRDLRLVRSSHQLPFLFHHPSITRRLSLEATLAPDPKKPSTTRWQMKVPRSRLPLSWIGCETRTPLFKRSMTLYELNPDDRGELHARTLGTAEWIKTPERSSRQFTLRLGSIPLSDTLFLATDNADNPPIELTAFETHYPVTRLVFKSSTMGPDPLHLYYGSTEANRPSYDLSLVASQLLRAEKRQAQLLAEEQLRAESWAERGVKRHAGVLFWAALTLVVVGLLVVVARLLPRPGSPAA